MLEIRDALVLDADDRSLLLTIANKSRSPYRNRALLQLCFHYGPTPRQLLGLEIGHVNFLARRIHWPTHGVDSRMPDSVLHALTAYVSFERNPRSPALFTTKLGHPVSIGHINRLFARLSEESGLEVNPYTLRLGTLYTWLEAHPVKAVAGLLGRHCGPLSEPATWPR